MKKLIITLEVEGNVKKTIKQLENLLDESNIECYYNIEEQEDKK